MQAELVIRPATREDAPIVSELAHRIWPVCFAGIIRPEHIENMLQRIYSIDNLHREMAEGHQFWLASRSGEPLGYASAYKKDDTIWLKKLYVLPALQRQGIGAALTTAATNWFLPARELKLLVNRDNLTAQRFYEHKGFTQAGEVPVQMGDNWFVDFIFSKPIAA